jgi:hypothetical protein
MVQVNAPEIDLTSQSCQKCLDVVIKELPDDNGRIGGHAYYESCYVRFKIYPFIDN